MTHAFTSSDPSDRPGLIQGADGHCRCWWPGTDPQYLAYHDQEWGRPLQTDSVSCDRLLFEKLCLEGFQAGLSWLTILRKRDNFRRAFANFELDQLVTYGEAEIKRLVEDVGIVRHRGKIESVLNNARRAQELRQEYGSLAAFFWQFEPDPATRPPADYATLSSLGQTPESQALSKALKKRGWTFVGPTTMYALMQAMGIVNDHLEGCWVREQVEAERLVFPRGQIRP